MILDETRHCCQASGDVRQVLRNRHGLRFRGAKSVRLEQSEEYYAFGNFRLYPKQRMVLCGAEPVAIGSRAFDMLLRLVSRAGVVVSVTELRDYVWPSITVDDANLRVQMNLLRKALSRFEGAGHAIETIPLRGYCFIMPVQHHPNGGETKRYQPRFDAPPPSLLNPTLGRGDAIETVAAIRGEGRLISMTIHGGPCRTTVAIATANRYACSFQGLIVFVDLSHVTEGRAAAKLIVKAFGLECEGDVIAALCNHLRSRDLLLILDTCGHVVEPIAILVESLLGHCPELEILVMSREVPRATGDWRVDILSAFARLPS